MPTLDLLTWSETPLNIASNRSKMWEKRSVPGVTSRGVSRLWHLRSGAKFLWRMSRFFEPLPSPDIKCEWDMKDAICSSHVTPPSLSQLLCFWAQGRLQCTGTASHGNALFFLWVLRHGMLSSTLQTVASPPSPGGLLVSATWDIFFPGSKKYLFCWRAGTKIKRSHLP